MLEGHPHGTTMIHPLIITNVFPFLAPGTGNDYTEVWSISNERAPHMELLSAVSDVPFPSDLSS